MNNKNHSNRKLLLTFTIFASLCFSITAQKTLIQKDTVYSKTVKGNTNPVGETDTLRKIMIIKKYKGPKTEMTSDSVRFVETDIITRLTETAESEKIEKLQERVDDYEHRFDILEKQIDDLLWFERLGDVAFIDKVRLTSTPRWKPKDPEDRFSGNKLQFYTYVFIPKDIDRNNKYPLLVLPHSGIHANFSTYYYHIVREFISQGYIVVSAEYRGSTGYGKTTYENIDYGGRENDDVLTSRDYMIENYDIVDSARVGIAGWSHGGMIALMQILQYGDKYQCAFAGVPVTDLENRLATHDQSYTDYFTAPYHIGETIQENPEEYKQRSPTHYAKNLEKPLLIYTNTIDNDVYVEEVKLMIETLKIYDRKFEYKIFEEASGGHGFDRIDAKEATDIRYSVHKFLETYLTPPKPFKSQAEMRKAAYGF